MFLHHIYFENRDRIPSMALPDAAENREARDGPVLRSQTSSAPPDLTPQQLFLTVLHEIKTAVESKIIEHNNVPPEAGSLVCNSLIAHQIIEDKLPR
jgi:hypothetical protein